MEQLCYLFQDSENNAEEEVEGTEEPEEGWSVGGMLSSGHCMLLA